MAIRQERPYDNGFEAVTQLNSTDTANLPPNNSSELSNRSPLAIALVLFLIYFAFGALGRAMEDGLNATGLLSSQDGGESEMTGLVVLAAVTLIWTLAATATELSCLVWALRKKSGAETGLPFKRSIELQFIENLRSLAAIIFRIPLFVFPALFEWLRLSSVPMIVLWDDNYRNGSVDALEAARRFFFKHKIFVLLMLLPSLAVLSADLLLTSTPEDVLPIWRAPGQHALSIGSIAALRLIGDFVVQRLYRLRILSDKIHPTSP